MKYLPTARVIWSVVGLIAGISSVLFCWFIFPSKAQAVINSCIASVSPNTVELNGSEDFVFTVQNNDPDNAYVWVKITRPSANYLLNYASSWTPTAFDEGYVFTDGSVNGGYTASFFISVSSVGSVSSGDTWVIETSDDPGGANATTCGGTVTTSITNPPEPIAISNRTVENITQTSATIVWDTNVEGTTEVYYNTYSGPTESVIDTTPTTHHVAELSGLEPGTYYYYGAQSTGGGNTAWSSSEPFRTLDTDVVPTSTVAPGQPTSTTAPTPTAPAATVGVPTSGPTSATATGTPTPTPVPDTISPAITVNKFSDTLYKNAPAISGHAVDDRGVTNIEYTTNNGKTWIRAQSIYGIGGQSIDFTIPLTLATGIYSIKVRASDAAGNMGTSISQKVTIDQIGPVTQLTTDMTKPFKESSNITGSTHDENGIRSVEYSLDGGINWQPVDKMESIKNDTVSYSFLPPPLDDGNYDVVIRSSDSVGNSAKTKSVTLVIDRLPPLVGPAVFMVGPQVIRPDAQGIYTVAQHMSQKIIVSAVGGPTTIAVQLVSSDYGSHSESVELQKNSSNGLWSGYINYSKSGFFTIKSVSKDGANKESVKDIGFVNVLPYGIVQDREEHPISGATLEIYVFDIDTGSYVLWDAASYGQNNPQKTNADGSYYVYLPNGKYYLRLQAPYYRTVQSDIFTVDTPTPLNMPIHMTKTSGAVIGSVLNIIQPDHLVVQMQHNSLQFSTLSNKIVSGMPANFRLDGISDSLNESSFSNVRTLLAVMTTWSQDTASQIIQIDLVKREHPEFHILSIFPMETLSKITVYALRGGYTIPMYTDPDGLLLNSLTYQSTPMWILIDEKGAVEQRVFGILTADQIQDMIHK